MASGTLITDGGRALGEPPSLTLSDTGYSGAREFIVDTHDEANAIASCGVAPGDRWSASLPLCIARTFRTRYIARKDGASGTGGLTVVRVEYAQITGRALPPPSDGQQFTVLTTSTETQTIFADLDAPADPGSPPIPVAWPLNDGQGFAKKVGVVSAKVYVYLPLATFPNMTRLIRLTRKKAVNTDALTFPVLAGTTVHFTLTPGQAQYEGFTHQTVNNLLEVVHELSLAPDFRLRWRYENESGYPEGAEISSRVYEAEPLAGLW